MAPTEETAIARHFHNFYEEEQPSEIKPPEGHKLVRKDVLVEKRKPEDPNEEIMCCYTIGQYPEPIKLKVKLLSHFWSYLSGEIRHKDFVAKALQNLDDPELIGKKKDHTHQGIVFVRKWFQTKHATIFVISNSLIQVVFNDASEILLGGQVSDFSKEVVTWINKKGRKINHLLKTALEVDDADFQKKLKYSNEIILRLVDTKK